MSAGGSFDGLGGPKHERVVRALEQVNGLRYRYHPAPQEAKKMLRFDSESDSDGDPNDGDGDEDGDEISDDEKERRRQRHARKELAKRSADGESDATALTLDDHIENLLRKTRTLALLRIASNTAQMVPCSDSDDEDEESNDVVADELARGAASSPKHGASLGRLANLVSIGSKDKLNGLLGTAAMKLARTLSAFLCLPHAISYGDLEAITEKLLDSSGDQFDEEEEYRDLIDCHVDSPRDSGPSADATEDTPIWKRRNSRPVRPLTLLGDPTDLELHQRQMFMEANRFGSISTRNMFLASSKHLLSKEDPNGSMYLGVSASGRMLGSFKAGSSASLHLGRQANGSTAASSTKEELDETEEGGDVFDEAQYHQWRTQVKEDYLAWVNAKVEASKRRKSRAKKGDPKKKPRWLLLYEASLNPTRKYRPDSPQ